jgi:hypothetical protein
MKFTLPFLAIAALFASSVKGHDAAASMAAAAANFLNTLTVEQREKATYGLSDPERKNWHYVPKPFEGKKKRGGLPLKEMRADQKHLAYALLSTGLSLNGFTTALQIMSLEQVLWEIEQDPKRDTSMYYFSVFGKPDDQNWGWRVEGHHISINFTIADGNFIAGTPVFFASNPAEVLEGPRKGLRVLAAEEDIARSFVKSLSNEQKEKAMIMDKAPQDILTAARQKVDPMNDSGLNYEKLNEDQKTQLNKLIDVYLRRLRESVANDEWGQIRKAGLDKLFFAWAGRFEKNQPHYYRVQGPTFLLEYANTQNGANHVHAVWRDFDGDFGEDLLRKHYAEFHR